jgi:hypothetical protein
MSHPERSDITQLRAIQKKVDDAAYATTAAAAMLSTASDMADYAAIAAADAKAAVDKVHAAAAAATKTAEVLSHPDTTNPSTAATKAPKDLPNNNDPDSTRQPSAPRPTQPQEESSIISQLLTILDRILHALLCIPWAVLLLILLCSILMHARAVAHSLGIDDSHLTSFCSICAVLAVTFAIDVLLRAGRVKMKLELAEEQNARVGG